MKAKPGPTVDLHTLAESLFLFQVGFLSPSLLSFPVRKFFVLILCFHCSPKMFYVHYNKNRLTVISNHFHLS